MNVGGRIQQTGNNPQDVTVYGGDGLSVGNGSDSTGCIPSNAGKCEQAVEIRRYDAAPALHDLTGAFLQIAYPIIVAETLPQF